MKDFSIEKSVYIMMGFIAVFCVFFMIIRTDYFSRYSFFNDQDQSETAEIPIEKLADSYEQTDFYMLVSNEKPLIEESVTSILEQMGKKVEKQFINETTMIPTGVDGVIIATENITELPDVTTLLDYVDAGGSVFFAVRPSPGPGLSSIYQQIGIVEAGPFVVTEGVELTEPLFDGTNNRSFPSASIRNSSLAVRISQKSELHATSSDNLPLMWSVEYGKGKFIVFNGSMFADPAQSALFIKGLQLMVPEFIYPVINAKVTVLEGFPFPIMGGSHKSGMTYEEYYRNIVWAAMQRLESKYDLNYSASFVASFDEEEKTFNPYELSASQENAIFFSRELLRMGGELGVQGYNHLPVEKVDPTVLGELLQDTSNRMAHALPGYAIKSYIPIDRDHPFVQLDVFKNVFPELSAVLGGTGNRFGLEGDVAVFPTTFSGFGADSHNRWMVFNSLASSGYVSQSMNLQSLMSEHDFDSAMQDLSKFHKELSEEVPWLRGMTLSAATKSLENFTESTIFQEETEEGMTFHVNRINSPAFYFFSTDRRITSTENCEVTKIGKNLYLVEANELTFQIGLDGLE